IRASDGENIATTEVGVRSCGRALTRDARAEASSGSRWRFVRSHGQLRFGPCWPPGDAPRDRPRLRWLGELVQIGKPSRRTLLSLYLPVGSPSRQPHCGVGSGTAATLAEGSHSFLLCRALLFVWHAA